MSSNIQDGNKLFEQHLALDGKQNANETSAEFDAKHARAIALIVDKLDAAISGGVVKLEGAPYASYPNAWVTLATVTVTAGKGIQSINVNENDDGMPCAIVRARITTQIGNGTVDVYIAVQG